MTTVLPPDADWVSRLADETIAEAEKRGTKVVVASGISPSGPVHLGNLREVMTPHLVQSVLGQDLSKISETKPEQLSKAMEPETADQLTDMMKLVVTNGTGTQAAVPAGTLT